MNAAHVHCFHHYQVNGDAAELRCCGCKASEQVEGEPDVAQLDLLEFAFDAARLQLAPGVEVPR